MKKSEKQSGKKKENIFFRKADDGRDIFYPWCYPGEAFYINEKQKKKIGTFLFIFDLTFISCFIIPEMFRTQLSNYINSDFIMAAAGMFFPVLYIFSMHLFRKNKGLYCSRRKIKERSSYS
jgi:hypothetical protein